MPGETLWRKSALALVENNFSGPILREWLGAAATPERIEQMGNDKEELYRELVRKNGMQALPGASGWIHGLHEIRSQIRRVGSRLFLSRNTTLPCAFWGCPVW